MNELQRALSNYATSLVAYNQAITRFCDFLQAEEDIEGLDKPNSTCVECDEVTLTVDYPEGFFCATCGFEKV